MFLDNLLKMETHADFKVPKSCFPQLHKVGIIRQYRTTEACKTLVHTFGNALHCVKVVDWALSDTAGYCSSAGDPDS